MIEQLDIPIYNSNILFMVETTEEEFDEFISIETNKNHLSDNDIKDIKNCLKDDGVSGMTMRPDIGGGYIVLIKKITSTNFLPHEIYHVCDRILKDRGVEHTPDDEAYAYLIGWVFEQYFNLFNIELTIKTEEKCE